MVWNDKVKYEGSIGTSIAKVFDMTVAATGIAAKSLRQSEIAYHSITIHPNSHAGYYPGATPMSIKVIFSPGTGKLLGAQIVGYDGVDKRIDQFAQVIKNNGSVSDLTRIEHAYAPPYSSAKDPVALAGYVAENVLTDSMTPIYWRELRDTDKDSITLIDVRTADEFATGAIDGAINIPLDDMRRSIDRIPTDKPIVLCCGVGLRGYLASNILRQRGFKNVRNLIGGLKTYRGAVAKTDAMITGGSDKAQPKMAQKNNSDASVVKIDACGLSCPGPIMKLKQAVETAPEGAQIQIEATDPGFARDAQAWCESTGNNFISHENSKGINTVLIKKGGQKKSVASAPQGKGKSFIMFSDDLDKALATFVLANGAASTGEKVTIFFTFWGLNVIKKESNIKTRKDIFGKMFGMMLPNNSRKLKLSKMNMGGLGAKMMRYIMNRKNIDSLETLRDMAAANGVEFIACQMSMDVMGITKEELLDNVTIGGVATYMNRAENANVNLFI